MKTVFCAKLKKNLPGLEKPPFPNALGQRIANEISMEAWQLWMDYQTKLINELKLRVFEPEAQKILQEHAEDFFFGSGLLTQKFPS
jgi:Fe-S cluster biosynthesis and repair protein YggX